MKTFLLWLAVVTITPLLGILGCNFIEVIPYIEYNFNNWFGFLLAMIFIELSVGIKQ